MEENNIEKNIKPLWQFITGKFMKVIFIFIGVLFLFLFLHESFFTRAFSDLLSNKKCDTADVDCFISAADNCESAELRFVDEIGLFTEYFSAQSNRSPDSCVLIKRIISLDENEPEEIKSLLTDRSFICDYTKGNFDEQWISSLVSGIEKCQGRLRKALDQLIVII